jgi:hypothetical protein
MRPQLRTQRPPVGGWGVDALTGLSGSVGPADALGRGTSRYTAVAGLRCRRNTLRDDAAPLVPPRARRVRESKGDTAALHVIHRLSEPCDTLHERQDRFRVVLSASGFDRGQKTIHILFGFFRFGSATDTPLLYRVSSESNPVDSVNYDRSGDANRCLGPHSQP